VTKARNIASAAPAPAGVTSTELGYIDGVTSAIQTQIDAKLATSTAASTYVPNSLADAKGDLIVGTADNTISKLTVGANGQSLVADSTTTSGLRWQDSQAAGKNAVINGGMDIWQRGTSFAGTTLGAYGADRWGYYRGGAVGGATWTRQSSGLTGFQYSLRAQRNSGDTSTQYVGIWQGIETINSIPYAGKTVTVSFYAKCGANYSASANGLGLNLLTGTGTDEPPFNFTGSAVAIAQYATLTTSWQRFTFTATLPTNTNEISIQIIGYPTGTAGANDWFEVTGVQLEVGSVATPFSRAGGDIQGELAKCQRYFYKAVTGVNTPGWMCAYYTSSAIISTIRFPVTMRTSPTFVVATGTDYYVVVVGGGLDGLNTLIQEVGTPDAATIYNNTQAAGTIGYGGNLISNNASASLAWSAEL
jgi:hypothetical protein